MSHQRMVGPQRDLVLQELLQTSDNNLLEVKVHFKEEFNKVVEAVDKPPHLLKSSFSLDPKVKSSVPVPRVEEDFSELNKYPLVLVDNKEVVVFLPTMHPNSLSEDSLKGLKDYLRASHKVLEVKEEVYKDFHNNMPKGELGNGSKVEEKAFLMISVPSVAVKDFHKVAHKDFQVVPRASPFNKVTFPEVPKDKYKTLEVSKGVPVDKGSQ